MKPVFKALRSLLLKLRYDGPHSNFAFKFNLRRYSMGSGAADQSCSQGWTAANSFFPSQQLHVDPRGCPPVTTGPFNDWCDPADATATATATANSTAAPSWRGCLRRGMPPPVRLHA
jgi:hypothetical protein